MARTKTVNAIELIMDWSLWPRFEAQELNTVHIRQMKEALSNGGKLPPILVDTKSNRIVDGFHRVRAVLQFYGDEAQIEAEFREFKNEAEMLLESARINSRHGLALTPQDRMHVFLELRRKKVPAPAIAEALGMDPEELKKRGKERNIKTKNGNKYPVPMAAAKTLWKKWEKEEAAHPKRKNKERVLTREEEAYARSAGGVFPVVHARLLMNALRAQASPLTDAEAEVLEELKGLLDAALKRYWSAA